MNAITPTTAPADDAIRVADSAYARVAKVVSGEPQPSALRIAVEGGGCSGFSYRYDIVPAVPNGDDVVFEKDGGMILIDTLSIIYMKGSVIEFVDDLIGQAFKISNPNAVASCGCGTSFSV